MLYKYVSTGFSHYMVIFRTFMYIETKITVADIIYGVRLSSESTKYMSIKFFWKWNIFSIKICSGAVCCVHKEQSHFNVVCDGMWKVSIDMLAWNILSIFRLMFQGWFITVHIVTYVALDLSIVSCITAVYTYKVSDCNNITRSQYINTTYLCATHYKITE